MNKLRKSWRTVATLFVVVTLVGGPAYAAGLAKNSVRSKHIKDGQVFAQDIATDAVGEDEIGVNAVHGGEIAGSAVGTGEIQDGSVADDDMNGFPLRTQSVTVAAGSAAILTATCNAGETAISGGATWDGAPTVGPVYIAQIALGGNSGADGAVSHVTVTGRNEGAGSRTLTAQVLCLA